MKFALVLEHICQTYKDSNGALVTTPVFAYYQRVMNAICPFSKDVHFLVSLCNDLIDGLTTSASPQFSVVITQTTVNPITCLLPITRQPR